MVKKILALLLGFTLSGCSLFISSPDWTGKPAPVATYYLLDGSAESTGAHLGKVLVLVFWDAACRHCRSEVPKVNQLAESFRGNDEISFIAVSLNDANEQEFLEQTIDQFNLRSMKQAFSGNGPWDGAFVPYEASLIPYIVLIGRDGVVRWSGNSASGLREPLIEEMQKKAGP